MTELTLDVHTSPERELTTGGLFSPTTSTLVFGPSEVVLVDAQYMEDDVAEIARRIDTSGRRLTTVHITHAHADHYFGLEWLLRRFPQARGVAHPSVVADIRTRNDASRAQWKEWFAGAALDNTSVPDALDTDVITVDGEELRIVEIGQADCAHNTAVHIPGLDAVITGDVVYNGINPFLAETGPEQWVEWVASIDKIAALAPRVVVAGHKRPELADDAATVDATRAYITDFIRESERTGNSRELVARMQELHPDRGNPSALVLSAVLAFKRKRARA